MKCITRKEAKELGLRFYFTGVPCPAGHISKRRVPDYCCIKCSTEKALRRYRRDPEWRRRTMEQQRRYQEDPVVLARLTAYRKTYWHRRNRDEPERRAEMVARYRAAKDNRMPVWANRELIRDVYRTAQRRQRNTRIRVAVDHVIPLRGKLVSGLHVHNNLQILTLSENCKKASKFIP